MCIVDYPITTQNALACEFINAPPCDPYHISLLQLDQVNHHWVELVDSSKPLIVAIVIADILFCIMCE